MVSYPLCLLVHGDDIEIYRDMDYLLSGLEAVDVSRGTYKLFDADGRMLGLVVDDQQVRLGAVEDEPRHAMELALLLRTYLVRIGMPEAMARDMQLQGLVSECARYALYDRDTSWRGMLKTLRSIFGYKRFPRWEPRV